MKAVTYTTYGSADVLKMTEIEKPEPKANEVLVRIHATTVTIGDTIMRSLNIPGPRWQRLPARLYLGFFRPKRPVLGMELAGVVEATGGDVTRFKPGDDVLASTFSVNFGGYAEYKCFPEDGMILHKPEELSFEEAAALVGGGMTAVRCLQKANLQSGQKVLIYGASGSVGTYAVQIAKAHGAEVTAVCSTRNLDLVRSLGAEHVIDYTAEDFTESGLSYDVIFDAVGKLDATHGKKALKAGGTTINVHKDSGGKEQHDDLLALIDLVKANKLRPVIDRCYAMSEIVEAHRYVETGRKRGNVAIRVV